MSNSYPKGEKIKPIALRKQRTSAYKGTTGERQEQSSDTYSPVPNAGLVRPLASGSEEYLRILPFEELLESSDDLPPRTLYVHTDAAIELNGEYAELIGDSRFIFNALVAARRDERTSLELIEFGSGFRNLEQPMPKKNIATYFARAVQALDAWSHQVSDQNMVARSRYGSGKQHTFHLSDDLRVIDSRQD